MRNLYQNELEVIVSPTRSYYFELVTIVGLTQVLVSNYRAFQFLRCLANIAHDFGDLTRILRSLVKRPFSKIKANISSRFIELLKMRPDRCLVLKLSVSSGPGLDSHITGNLGWVYPDGWVVVISGCMTLASPGT